MCTNGTLNCLPNLALWDQGRAAAGRRAGHQPTTHLGARDRSDTAGCRSAPPTGRAARPPGGHLGSATQRRHTEHH